MRTIPVIKKHSGISAYKLQVLSELMGRRNLATKMGQQYDGARDIYQALGYPQDISFDEYLGRYLRQDMAKAIIDRPVKATWQGELELVEPHESEETLFEKAWADLNRALGLKTILARLDRLTGIGEYGVLLLGLSDVKNPDMFQYPVRGIDVELVYMKPFSQKNATIYTWETDTKNPRYGKPLMYRIEVHDVNSGTSQTNYVHYTRIIHITDDNLESEIYGTPRLQPVYNRLMDLDKIVGADAEMFWRGARPGFQGIVDKDFELSPDVEEELITQFDEYENKLRRLITLTGVKLEELKQTISDPTPHVSVIIQMISAQTGIPQRVLTGSERGELASTQDSSEWLTYVQSRRDDHAEPNIIRPLVTRLIEIGILPEPNEDYIVDWSDLFSMSEKAMVEIGKGRSNSIREYTTNPIAEAIMPPDAFLEVCLGLSTEKITLIKKMRDEALGSELDDFIRGAIEVPPEPAAGTAPATRTKPAGSTVPAIRTKTNPAE